MGLKTFRFLDWQVYADAQGLFSKILLITKAFPSEYRFTIGSQIIRSSLSIILNVAEGSGKSSKKELARYLDISIGSAYETAACIDTLARNKLISNDERNSMINDIEIICRQLGGLKQSLKKSS
jgi:four helix bundle protein